ncbi:MAG: ATP-binding cassette domain-containing protein, partial [Anaerolineae bacterium]
MSVRGGAGRTSDEARPLISAEGVMLRRPGGEGDRGIWWQILDGQQWAVIGPNGSGKSTLVRMLSGRVAAGPGRIVHHFGGGAAEPGSEAGAGLARNAVAYVDFRLQRSFMNREAPYHQARWNSLSRQDSPRVSEYLSEKLVTGIRPDQAAASSLQPARFDQEREQVAQLLGIEALLDRRLVQISSGERRRVLLARALLQKPRLLILDNPFAGLDQAFRPALRG